MRLSIGNARVVSLLAAPRPTSRHVHSSHRGRCLDLVLVPTNPAIEQVGQYIWQDVVDSAHLHRHPLLRCGLALTAQSTRPSQHTRFHNGCNRIKFVWWEQWFDEVGSLENSVLIQSWRQLRSGARIRLVWFVHRYVVSNWRTFTAYKDELTDLQVPDTWDHCHSHNLGPRSRCLMQIVPSIQS